MADAVEEQNSEPVTEPKPQEAATPAPPVQTQVVKTFDEQYVKDLRNEAKANRIKADELQKQLDESNAKLNSISARAKDAFFESAFTASLGDNAPLYPDLVMSKIDRTQIDLDESGAVKDKAQITAQIKDIAEKYPALFSKTPSAQRIDAGAKGDNDNHGVDLSAGLRAMLNNSR